MGVIPLGCAIDASSLPKSKDGLAAQKNFTAPQHGCALRRQGPVRYSHTG